MEAVSTASPMPEPMMWHSAPPRRMAYAWSSSARSQAGEKQVGEGGNGGARTTPADMEKLFVRAQQDTRT